MRIKYSPLGDVALVIDVLGGLSKETTSAVRAITAQIELASNALIKEVVPSFTTVTIFYEVRENFQYKEMTNFLENISTMRISY